MSARLDSMGQEKYRGLTVLNNGRRVFNGKISFDEAALSIPLNRKKPTTYFVNSMSDLFHAEVPIEFVAKVFAVMGYASWHTFQVLTKRTGYMAELLNDPKFAEMVEEAGYEFSEMASDAASRFGLYNVHNRLTTDWRAQDHTALPLDNVWLGTSCENQQTADERIPHLLKCPAGVRFLSCEPLLGATDLTNTPYPSGMAMHRMNCLYGYGGWSTPRWKHKIDWVIVGGESGPGARPMHPDSARSIRDQCNAAGVAFFFKQWGRFAPWIDDSKANGGGEERFGHVGVHLDGRHGRIAISSSGSGLITNHDSGFEPDGCFAMAAAGKKAAGRLLDGRTWDEMPTDLRVRDIPAKENV